MSIRVLVTGCRRWHCPELADRVVNRLIDRYGRDWTLIHGAAPGVDSAFALSAEDRGIATHAFPADWGRHGRAAGPLRNQAMVDAGATIAIAVHRDLAHSRGTGDCVRRCLAAGIPVYLIDAEDAEPRRIHEV